MKRKIIIPIVFVLMALAQWYIPLQMIKGNEDVLLTGTEFKFRTLPVDPYDAFRGKYVQLNFRDNVYKTKDSLFQYKDEVYVLLENDTDGFAKIQSVRKKEPLETDTYIKSSVSSFYKIDSIFELRVEYPFNRYYMEEFKAPKADSLYLKATRDTLQAVYALVAVKKGEAVLTDVKINDRSLKDYFEKK